MTPQEKFEEEIFKLLETNVPNKIKAEAIAWATFFLITSMINKTQDNATTSKEENK